jgi:septal ring factor EnvC (AmiA/AmiB activator)
MYRRAVVLTTLFLLSPFAAPLAQRRGTSTPPPAATAQPSVDPSVQKLEHAAEVQATEGQTEKFHTMLASTRLARQQASDLQRQAASSNDSIELTHRATTLEDSVDQALTDYRSFRRSLSQQQEAEEKPRMKKLIKAAHSVGKDGDAMEQRLEQVPLDQRKLASLAEHLEKELTEFLAAQGKLGKELGIESQ